jgi:hypothetical protein
MLPAPVELYAKELGFLGKPTGTNSKNEATVRIEIKSRSGFRDSDGIVLRK